MTVDDGAATGAGADAMAPGPDPAQPARPKAMTTTPTTEVPRIGGVWAANRVAVTAPDRTRQPRSPQNRGWRLASY